MVMIGYDPARVMSLHGATQRAIDDLVRVASQDPVAAGAMPVVRSVPDVLERDWLPMIERVLASDAMVTLATVGLTRSPGRRCWRWLGRSRRRRGARRPTERWSCW